MEGVARGCFLGRTRNDRVLREALGRNQWALVKIKAQAIDIAVEWVLCPLGMFSRKRSSLGCLDPKD